MTEYINFCVNTQIKEKEVVCFPNNKPWITKDLKNLINEKKLLFTQGDKTALKLKQKELRREIIKCKENYKRKNREPF